MATTSLTDGCFIQMPEIKVFKVIKSSILLHLVIEKSTFPDFCKFSFCHILIFKFAQCKWGYDHWRMGHVVGAATWEKNYKIKCQIQI
jgi:hypothetical protein